MNEYMGNIFGKYDAKEEGFKDGGASLHSTMTPHGPDADAFKKASSGSQQPQKYSNTLAFMFESTLFFKICKKSIPLIKKDEDYYKCWDGLDNQFKKTD